MASIILHKPGPGLDLADLDAYGTKPSRTGTGLEQVGRPRGPPVDPEMLNLAHFFHPQNHSSSSSIAEPFIHSITQIVDPGGLQWT